MVESKPLVIGLPNKVNIRAASSPIGTVTLSAQAATAEGMDVICAACKKEHLYIEEANNCCMARKINQQKKFDSLGKRHDWLLRELKRVERRIDAIMEWKH